MFLAAKLLLTAVVGCGIVGLFLMASPAPAADQELTLKCKCTCGGKRVVTTDAAVQTNCVAGQICDRCLLHFSGQECSTDGAKTSHELLCDGSTILAFPKPPPDPPTLTGPFDPIVSEIGTLRVIDLLPLPAQAGAVPEGGGSSLCRLSADLNKLQVHVHNQGTATAPPSTVHIEFANNPGGVDIPTPELVRGGSAVLEIAPPASCVDASNNCHFTIGVDSTNAVEESDELNNNAAGVCGPSFL